MKKLVIIVTMTEGHNCKAFTRDRKLCAGDENSDMLILRPEVSRAVTVSCRYCSCKQQQEAVPSYPATRHTYSLQALLQLIHETTAVKLSEATPSLGPSRPLVAAPSLHPSIAAHHVGQQGCLVQSIAGSKEKAEIAHSIINCPMLDVRLVNLALDLQMILMEDSDVVFAQCQPAGRMQPSYATFCNKHA